MAEKRNPGIKKIRMTLREAAFDPNKPGMMSIIADSNDDYIIQRTIELLREVQEVKKEKPDCYSVAGVNHNLKLSMSLLALYVARNTCG
jgi:hypothetical protein